jgi:predicted phage tail protein
MINKVTVNVFVNGTLDTVEVNALSLKDVFSFLKMEKGSEYTDSIINSNYKYVLGKTEDPEDVIALIPEVIGSSFGNYDVVFLVPEITGEEPISLSIAASAAMGMVTTAGAAAIAGGAAATAGMLTTMGMIAAYAITAVVMIAVSFAVSAIMQALSPTAELSSDPGTTQTTSNLFNTTLIVKNQGGSVPLVFGSPYCGAVLISSSVKTTTEVPSPTPLALLQLQELNDMNNNN